MSTSRLADNADEPTQPFSPPGHDRILQRLSEVQAERDDGEINGNGDDGDARDHVHDDEMTLSDSSDGHTCDGNMVYHNNAVTWNDVGNQKQRGDGIHLDIFLDTMSNTCLFKLYCSVLHKGSKAKGQKHTLFLFIHPESVREITLSNGRSSGPSTSKPSRPMLSFSLTQRPSLVVPKGHVLETKEQSKGALNIILALAQATEFTLHLNNSNLNSPLKKSRLELIARKFSPDSVSSRPLTNERCAHLGSLYAGRGGEVIDIDKATGALTDEADAPPSYAGPAHGQTPQNKRRRIDSPIDKGKSPAVENDLFSFIRTSFDTMENRLCARIDSMAGQIKTQLDDFGTRLDKVEIRLRQLEDTVTDAIDHDHSASIQGEISEQLDDCITGIKVETEEVFKSIDDRFDETMERLEQEVGERMNQLEEDVKDCTVEIVESSLKRKLTNASLRVDGSVFLDL
ncbi:hypothetical protein HDV57DRAFT_479441 [Trichoderma longibrachiatum]